MYFSTVDNKLRNFQLKLIHRCLPRRRILFISNMCDSPMCNFCKTEPDSLVHIYALCPMIQTFWVQIIELINMLFPNITSLTTIDIIFGSFMSKNQLLSFIIIAAKYYIHCCYWSERSPNIDLLKDKLIKYELIERLNAIKTDKIPLHNGKWERFINIFGKINVV